jgi:hypothetical protein
MDTRWHGPRRSGDGPNTGEVDVYEMRAEHETMIDGSDQAYLWHAVLPGGGTVAVALCGRCVPEPPPGQAPGPERYCPSCMDEVADAMSRGRSN